MVQSCLPKGCLVHQTQRIFGAHGSQPTTVAVTRLRSTATLSLGLVGNAGVVLLGPVGGWIFEPIVLGVVGFIPPFFGGMMVEIY